MGKAIIEVAHKPEFKSVSDYDEQMKSDAPSPQLEVQTRERDIECQCCSQQAPVLAAALCKVEDTTPVTVSIDGKKGVQVWICADCYHYGVRPTEARFGNIHWNKEGLKIKQRAERRTGHPW